MNKQASEVPAQKMSVSTVATGLLVSALVLGGILSIFFPLSASAEAPTVGPIPVVAPVEVVEIVDAVKQPVVQEESAAQAFARMLDTESDVTGETIVSTASSQPFKCDIVITGENGWTFDRLLDLAMKYGCTVKIDNTPAST